MSSPGLRIEGSVVELQCSVMKGGSSLAARIRRTLFFQTDECRESLNFIVDRRDHGTVYARVPISAAIGSSPSLCLSPAHIPRERSRQVRRDRMRQRSANGGNRSSIHRSFSVLFTPRCSICPPPTCRDNFRRAHSRQTPNETAVTEWTLSSNPLLLT